VSPRAVLDVVVKGKNPSPRWESNPRTPIVQPKKFVIKYTYYTRPIQQTVLTHLFTHSLTRSMMQDIILCFSRMTLIHAVNSYCKSLSYLHSLLDFVR
jgi:hypothetical protein